MDKKIQLAISKLLNEASECVRGVGMPSPFYEDHEWSKTIGVREKFRVIKQYEKALETHHRTGMRLKEIADILQNISS